MAVDTWTGEMDKALLDQRGVRGLGWKVVRIEGATRKDCQDRFKFLTSGQGKPVVKVGDPHLRGPDANEDGFDRMVKRGQLKGARLIMARHYRNVGRTAGLRGGGIRSCLDVGVGGGGNSGMPTPGEAFEVTAACRELFTMRWTVLRGQVDVLTALDGVLIGGYTLLALAGGEGRGARAAELRQSLYIGLDMLIAAAGERVKRAA